MKNYTLNISEANEPYLVSCKSVEFGDPIPGVQYRFKFPNGYGASVIKFWGSYGYEKDLWELAALDTDGHILYNDDFYDVVGSLTDEEVNEWFEVIKSYKEIIKNEKEI